MNKYIGLLVVVTACAQAAAPAEFKSIDWGVSERQGLDRTHMEDAYAAVLPFKGNQNEAFFGIYDGHGGDQAAIATAQGIGDVGPLHRLVAESRLSGYNIYKYAYQMMDLYFQEYSKESGTTAITAHIMPGKYNPLVYLAWVGDARAVLVNQSGTVSDVGTSIDHKPDNPKEKSRIEAAGGRIRHCEGAWRVGGILAIPRAIGDGLVKSMAKGIIADPEIKDFKLRPHHKALILACDGVWDVLSNEQAAQIVTDALQNYKAPLSADPIARTHEKTTEAGNNSRAQYAARTLRDAAINARSTDNVSVLVIEFNWQQEQLDTDWELARQLAHDERMEAKNREEQIKKDAELARRLQAAPL